MIFFKKKSNTERFAKKGRTGREFKEKQELALTRKRVTALEAQVKRGEQKNKFLDREKELKKQRFSQSTTGRFLKGAGNLARGTTKALNKSGMFAGKTVKRAAKTSSVRVQKASKKKGAPPPKDTRKPFGNGLDDFGKDFDDFLRDK